MTATDAPTRDDLLRTGVNPELADVLLAAFSEDTGVTHGTVTADKIAIPDANKDLGDFRNLDCQNLDAGASGTAGTVDIFPSSATSGKLSISCTDQTGDTTVSLTAGTMAAARTITIPDPGAAASVLLTTGTATATSATTAEISTLAGVSAGTAYASKAVVLGASKEIATITTATITTGNIATVNATNIDAGADAVAGTVDVFPSTTTSGKIQIACADNGGDYTVTLTNASHGQSTAVTIPDGGLATSYLLQSTAAITAAEADVLDGATVGTVVASKAVVASANKDVGDFRNLDCQNLDAGADAVAGTVDIFPSTTTSGKLSIACADNGGDYTVTLTNASHGQATTVTLPDGGAAASYLMQSTAAITLAEADVLDGATAGTIVASKAAVADGSSNLAGFAALGATNFDAGKSGTAGSVDVFPSTGTHGKLAITCSDQTGDTTVSLVAGEMAAARTITLRDPGAAASILTTTDGTAAATTATAAEITAIADVSARVQELTVSGAITAGVTMVELNHVSTVIAATIANAALHAGVPVTFKDTSASGTAAHTVTLTSGTFDGTNNIATFDAPGEQLVVVFGSDGNGLVILNTGTVGLSS